MVLQKSCRQQPYSLPLSGSCARPGSWRFGKCGHNARSRTESWVKPADKPGSVVDSHSSRRFVTQTLKQPTRRRREQRHSLLIWSCSGWSLPCRPCYHVRGGLLPRRFTLTGLLAQAGGLFSVALFITSRCPAINRHPALWSPDFPPRTCVRGDCLASFGAEFNTAILPPPASLCPTLPIVSRLPAGQRRSAGFAPASPGRW
jgi:hypothetical protein